MSPAPFLFEPQCLPSIFQKVSNLKYQLTIGKLFSQPSPGGGPGGGPVGPLNTDEAQDARDAQEAQETQEAQEANTLSNG